MWLCLLFIAAILSPLPYTSSGQAKSQSDELNIVEFKLVTNLPAQLPPRITSLAYDGEKIWVAIYHGRGRYAVLDPVTLGWKVSDADEHHKAIREVAGAFESPGGLCFVKDKLWVAGSYGESFG